MRSGREFRFPVYTFQTKKTALDYLYPFLSFSVHNFCARTADGQTDGQTFFEKVIFFSPDQEYIYMSIPISSISQMEMGMKRYEITNLVFLSFKYVDKS